MSGSVTVCRGSHMGIFSRLRKYARAVGFLMAFLLPGCNALIDPPVPRNLTATPASPHEITLTWEIHQYEDPGEIGYKIFRNGEYIDYTFGSSYVLTTWYDDSGLAPDTEYCYRVSSFYISDALDFTNFLLDLQNDSAQSNEACSWTYPLSAIKGTVSSGGEGLDGVEITLFRVFPHDTALSVFTGSDGFYRFTDLDNSKYVVTPSDPDFVFSPESVSVIVLNGEVAVINFEATATAGPNP